MSLRLRIALCLVLFTLLLLAGCLVWGHAEPLYFGLFLLTAPIALMLVLLFYSEQWVTRPLQHLTQAARQIANGEFGMPLPQSTGDEIGQLTKAFDAMQTRLTLREKRLIDNEVRLSAIIDNSVEALVTIDITGTLRSFNKAAERIFGYTADEVVGENIRILMPMPYRADHDRYIQRYLKTGVKKVIGIGQEVKGKRKSGELFPIWITVSEVKIDEDPLFVGSIMDITQQKMADIELATHRDNLRNMIHERTKDLKIAMEKAEAANQAKSNFISNMSHEIRTPMNAMLGFLALALENNNLTQELRDHLEIAHRSSWSLLGLLDDILDISKLEEGRMALEPTPFNLARLLRDITSSMEVAAREKGLTLTLSMPPPFPAYCSGDPMRIRQVLFNLLSNAIKFTHKGGVTIHAEPLPNDEIHFFIKDTGIGMSKDQLMHIFEPFAQADDSSTRRYGGTGLGTTISKHLVELMGGTIWVESNIGKGSTFHVTLTLPEAEAPVETKSPATEKTGIPPKAPRELSVLVAEDIAENAKLILIRLKQQGHKATATTNGKEVLRALASEPFDLILMDVHMPEMDGLEATRCIRSGSAGEACQHIPIIGLTASAGQKDVQECLEAGMNEVVTKPIDFKRLYATMSATHPLTGLPERPPPDEKALPLNEWPHLHGVDTRTAMETWQDKNLYLQSLSSFVTKFMTVPRHMLLALDSKSADSLYEEVHAMKGASANLCMTDINKTCEALSPLLATGKTEAIRALIVSLDSAFSALCRDIPPAPEETTASPHPPPAIPADKVQTWFQELLNGLASDNPDQVDPLLTAETACISTAHLKEIQAKVDVFNFRGAEDAARKAAHAMGINLNGRADGAET
ncbi:hypothetical protein DSLASN_35920 [Desulfoluna limicola]|uniref:histidine kinase n=1 Tax=Desulfoluna limicola TaxID=2810562 RepID=A0ABN6F868_9BACT|nr:ATP-binding protein [Desulfoluna limicola]BCS97960.1 hypothetical protein DSLASN_35920 [Desulfoluna limicola]